MPPPRSKTAKRPQPTALTLKKEISENTRPLFVNHFQVSHAGGDAYVDVGVIPLDDILSERGEARFVVLQRLVMGFGSLEKLYALVGEILEKTKRSSVANESIESKQSGLAQTLVARNTDRRPEKTNHEK